MKHYWVSSLKFCFTLRLLRMKSISRILREMHVYYEGDFILECSNSEWHPNFCLLVFIINKILFWTLVVCFTFINPKLSDKYWMVWKELSLYRIVMGVLLILNEITLFLCSIIGNMWYWLKIVTLLFYDPTGQEQIQL